MARKKLSPRVQRLTDDLRKTTADIDTILSRLFRQSNKLQTLTARRKRYERELAKALAAPE